MAEARRRPLLSRRAALRLAAASVLATVTGCRAANPSRNGSGTAPGGGTTNSSASVAQVDPTIEAVVHRVGDAERSLIAAYDDAIAAHPDLETLLAPFRADHATHLTGLLGSAGGVSESAGPHAAPMTPPGSLAPAAAGVAVVAQLAASEKAAAAARLNDMPADSPELARLIASIGACEASHGALLEAAQAEPVKAAPPTTQRSAT